MRLRRSTLAILVSLPLALGACAQPEKKTAIGAGVGTAAGAVVGGVTGGAKGAMIGAVAGGLVGGALGNYLDRRTQELRKVADAKRVREGILVTLKNDLVFQTAKSDVNPRSEQQLTELGQILAKYPKDHLRVTGFTDSVGADKYNEKLSDERAGAVANVLKEQGVKDDQLRVEGMGESGPVASNATSSGRAKNRRVEILIDATDSAKS